MKPKPEQIEAKVSELEKYGWLGAIDTLAGGDFTKWNAVMTTSFERVIAKLALNRDRDLYSERLQKVLAEKAKAKK